MKLNTNDVIIIERFIDLKLKNGVYVVEKNSATETIADVYKGIDSYEDADEEPVIDDYLLICLNDTYDFSTIKSIKKVTKSKEVYSGGIPV